MTHLLPQSWFGIRLRGGMRGQMFKKMALAVGLEGKMRSASAGESLKKELIEIAKSLSPYPHVKLNIPTIIRVYKPRPKARCSECGYEIGIFKK